MMGMKGIEGDISAGPGRSDGRVADRGSKSRSEIFFPLAQIIPINPHHPHHFGTFDNSRDVAAGQIRGRVLKDRSPPSRPRRSWPFIFARVLPEGTGLNGWRPPLPHI
jgi:hypothetical protein